MKSGWPPFSDRRSPAIGAGDDSHFAYVRPERFRNPLKIGPKRLVRSRLWAMPEGRRAIRRG